MRPQQLGSPTAFIFRIPGASGHFFCLTYLKVVAHNKSTGAVGKVGEQSIHRQVLRWGLQRFCFWATKSCLSHCRVEGGRGSKCPARALPQEIQAAKQAVFPAWFGARAPSSVSTSCSDGRAQELKGSAPRLRDHRKWKSLEAPP